MNDPRAVQNGYRVAERSIGRSSSNFQFFDDRSRYVRQGMFPPSSPSASDVAKPSSTALSLPVAPRERKVSTPAAIELAISRRACRFFLLKRRQILQRFFVFLWSVLERVLSSKGKRNHVCLSFCPVLRKLVFPKKVEAWSFDRNRRILFFFYSEENFLRLYDTSFRKFFFFCKTYWFLVELKVLWDRSWIL